MTGRLLQTVIRRAESLAAELGPDAVPDSELLARFAARRDEAAFAALVNRHGPMVWAVCRHLLLDPADAEDAFQATFLALVRSARKLPTGSAVGGWLHGVAVRSVAQLRRSAARRRQREERAARPEAGRPVPDSAWDALVAALHQEVQRLPEALRTAFVLCDLEGVRQPDAAARLGWKLGTLSGRLTKARQRLLERLAQRGIAPGLASGTLVVGAAATGGAVPVGLAMRTKCLAVAATEAVPPALWKLVLEVTPMTVNRMKLIAACVLLAGGLAAGLGPALVATADAQGPPTSSSPGGFPSAPPGVESGNGFPRLLGGEGDPVAPPSADSGTGSMMSGTSAPAGPGRTRWEYEFAAKPKSLPEFRNLLRRYGEQGWEFAGAESLDAPGAATSTVVFKRPVRAVATRGVTGPGFDPSLGGPPTAMVPGSADSFSPSLPGVSTPGGNPGSMPAMGTPGSSGGPGGYAPGGAGGFKVIALKHARAQELAATLKQLLGNVQVVGDARSNSIVLKTDATAAREIEELIRKLDVQGVDETGGSGGEGGGSPRPPGTGGR